MRTQKQMLMSNPHRVHFNCDLLCATAGRRKTYELPPDPIEQPPSQHLDRGCWIYLTR
jgi:hypothetical protein